MRKTVNLFLFALCITLVLPSCVSKKKFTELLNDKDGIAATLSETQKKVKDLEGEKSTLEDAKAQLETENGKLSSELSSAKQNLEMSAKEATQAKKMLSEKEAKVATYEKGIKGVFASYEGSGLDVAPRDSRLYVTMNEPVMFRSGSTRVARKYREELDKLAEVLKNNPALNIQVEGHSDNAKFVNGGSNWSLSMNRAMNTLSYLLRKGVDPNQLSAVGRGEFAPSANVEDPSSKEARAQNRRVEFVIVPNIGSVYSVNP